MTQYIDLVNKAYERFKKDTADRRRSGRARTGATGRPCSQQDAMRILVPSPPAG